MKFPKLTRKVIYAAAAKGKAAEITWPAKAPEPKRGHRYTLQSSNAAGENMLVVEAVRELPDGAHRATVRLTDQIRPLRTGAVRPIEANPFGGPQFRAEPEPEQVDTRHQERITQEGAMKTALEQGRNHHKAEVMRQERRLAEVRSRNMEGAARLVESRLANLKGQLDDAA